MKKQTFLIAGLLVVFFGCVKEDSENVNQDSIYTIYELFYNAAEDVTTARAVFRFGGPGGTLLDLTEPAATTFNGDELVYKPISGFHEKEYAGLTTSGTFAYTDLDNNSFTNATATIDAIDYPAVFDTIDATNAYTFAWTGNPVAANETVTLTINGSQQNNIENFPIVAEGANELILEADKLQNLGEGDATCLLTRVHNRADVDEGTSKGGRMAVWYTAETTVFISN